MTVRWTFTDMATSETLTLPWNPNKMTSPFLDNLTDRGAISPIDGESRSKRKKSPPKDWSFGGFIRTQAQHDLMLDWGLRSSLMHVTDHLGRTIACRFQTVVIDEKKPSALKPWKFEYTILALSYGKV